MSKILPLLEGMNVKKAVDAMNSRKDVLGNQWHVILSYTKAEEQIAEEIMKSIQNLGGKIIKSHKVEIQYPQRTLLVLYYDAYEFQSFKVAEAANYAVPIISVIDLFQVDGKIFRLVEQNWKQRI